MDYADWVLWLLLIVTVCVTVYAYVAEGRRARFVTEPFASSPGSVAGISLMDMSTQALDSAPTTSEAKGFYKTLLLFADADIRKQGTAALRILGDFRDRLYGRRNFRANLTVDDILADWPAWLPPLDPTVKESPPAQEDAVYAESRLLAYLQKNYPQEANVDEQTGSTVRNLIQDFGYRFVFVQGEETVALRPDFLERPLLDGWKNPVMASAVAGT
jgi:hypothetical protein